MCIRKIRTPLLGEKNPAGALAPSTVLLRGSVSGQRQNHLFVVIARQSRLLCILKIRRPFLAEESPCGSAAT